jgi:hypothetical protein
MTLTDEWLEVYNDSVKKNEDFKGSIWWRLAIDVLPEGVDHTDPRVIAAIKDIKIRLTQYIKI